jgi:hypothetical protein
MMRRSGANPLGGPNASACRYPLAQGNDNAVWLYTPTR